MWLNINLWTKKQDTELILLVILPDVNETEYPKILVELLHAKELFERLYIRILDD